MTNPTPDSGNAPGCFFHLSRGEQIMSAIIDLQGLVSAIDLIEQDLSDIRPNRRGSEALGYLIGRLVVQTRELAELHEVPQ